MSLNFGRAKGYLKDNIIELEYLYRDTVSTSMKVNYTDETVSIKNYTDDLIDRAFGDRVKITLKDFEEFLEDRCFSKTRFNKKELLDSLDLGNIGYDPLEIVKKTHGLMLEDYCWIKFKGESLTWEDIKIRD